MSALPVPKNTPADAKGTAAALHVRCISGGTERQPVSSAGTDSDDQKSLNPRVNKGLGNNCHRLAINVKAEDMGFEPTTHCWASDFESDRWPIRLSSVVDSPPRAASTKRDTILLRSVRRGKNRCSLAGPAKVGELSRIPSGDAAGHSHFTGRTGAFNAGPGRWVCPGKRCELGFWKPSFAAPY